MLEGERILIISPHPDDEAICCGGLIALAKKEKVFLYVLYVAVGNSRQFLTKRTTSKKRVPEIINTSRLGKFHYSILFKGREFMRLDNIPQKLIIETVEDITKKIKPTIICFPFRYSFDQDHRAVASASITAFRPLPKSLQPQPRLILEYEEPYSWTVGPSFQPNFYLDISEVIEEKIRLVESHKSQLRTDPFPRSPANLKRLAGLRGCEIGVKYAESYHLIKGQL